MNVISTNCCGGWYYRLNNQQFTNPFIWMVAPYTTIKNTMLNYDSIDWMNIEFKKSKIRKNTFILNIDKQIDLHYVHYFFDPKCSEPKIEKRNSTDEQDWSSDVYYCKIWEYIYKKYIERTKRMLEQKEKPCFLLREEKFGNNKSKTTLKDIAYLDSPYKRVIITTDESIKRNDEICKTILVKKIEQPGPTTQKYLSIINEFFGY